MLADNSSVRQSLRRCTSAAPCFESLSLNSRLPLCDTEDVRVRVGRCRSRGRAT